MTAEIVIMNREAVAMAADNAVTYGSGGEEKIFRSANKIFTLSKFRPVGLMVYGGAHFMDVPWETVVKVFRQSLGTTGYDRLEEYANAFFDFLCNDRRFSPEDRQVHHVTQTVTIYFLMIQHGIRERIQKHLDQKGEISKLEVDQLFRAEIETAYRFWKDLEPPKRAPADLSTQVRTAYKDIVVALKRKVFPKQLTSTTSRWLTEGAIALPAKSPTNDRMPGCSGVVIAGFGETDIFPAYCSYAVGGVVCDYAQIRPIDDDRIAVDNLAVVRPFAQREMVYTFMEGVDPDYSSEVAKSITDIVLSIPDLVVDRTPEIPQSQRATRKRLFKDAARRLLVEYRRRLDEYRRKTHADPIISAISALPKDELASVAESLVNLTAFKRRISLDAETVGGPVDVALISKGDGFIWIQRKHYFDESLNRHFMRTYYRSDREKTEEEG